MPGIQEIIALGIVALVVGRYVRRRWFGGRKAARGGDCGDCASSGPPPKESPVRFYRGRSR
jgi:hypothetical protein